jgi:AcrR family transcriptional regulator
MAHVPVAERRPQLVKAAIELMAREGASAGSTRAVAAELGVAQATVHYAFRSKQELQGAVLVALSQSIVGEVEQAAPDSAGFEETLTAWIHALWKAVREDRSRYVLLWELTMQALRDPYLLEIVGTHNRSIDTVVTQLVEDAARRSDKELKLPPEEIARFFLTGFDGIVLRNLTDFEERMARILLDRLVSSTVALALGEPPHDVADR